jgi:hypothetical protein
MSKLSRLVLAYQYAKQLLDNQEITKDTNTEQLAIEIITQVNTKYFLNTTDFYYLKRQIETIIEMKKKKAEEEDKEMNEWQKKHLEMAKAKAIAYDYAIELYQRKKSTEEIKQELKQLLSINVELSNSEIDNIINATIEAIETIRKATGEDNQEEQQ